MVTATLTCRLELPGIASLKEKRRLLKSLMSRLRNKFNISISEVGDNDVLRTATLGVAIVANNSRFAHQVIAKVIDWIEAEPQFFMADCRTELY